MIERRIGRCATLLLALVLLLLPALLAGCFFTAEVAAPDKTEAGVKKAFLEQYVKDASYTAGDLSVEYVGKYAEFDAVYVHGVLAYTQAEDQETVGGVIFRYPTGQHLLIYSHENGRLYTLQEAWDKEVLNATKLRAVYRAHRAAEPLMYEDMDDDDDDGPSAEESKPKVEAEVSDAYILIAFLERYHPECDLEDVSLLRVGVYDGCHAVFVKGPFLYADAITRMTVGGLEFVFPTSETVSIYYDGVILTLPEAWDAGLLSLSALRELHKDLPGVTGEAVQ